MPDLKLTKSFQGGDRFTDSVEQNMLIQVLSRTDRLHGWPTHELQHQLKETWGIHESD
jgi:hypothetical protein